MGVLLVTDSVWTVHLPDLISQSLYAITNFAIFATYPKAWVKATDLEKEAPSRQCDGPMSQGTARVPGVRVKVFSIKRKRQRVKSSVGVCDTTRVLASTALG